MLLPSVPERPDVAYERCDVEQRVRAAIQALPWREGKVIGLYYYGEVTMKEIGREIGVNESRVSQLHARAIRRLREALGSTLAPAEAAEVIRAGVLQFFQKPVPATVESVAPAATEPSQGGVVIPYPRASRAARSKSPRRNGFASQRQPLCARKRSASVPATSPVTNITPPCQLGRRDRDGPIERHAVEARHLQIAHDKLVGALAHPGERLLAIASSIHQESRIRQCFGHRRGERRFVLHH